MRCPRIQLRLQEQDADTWLGAEQQVGRIQSKNSWRVDLPFILFLNHFQHPFSAPGVAAAKKTTLE